MDNQNNIGANGRFHKLIKNVEKRRERKEKEEESKERDNDSNEIIALHKKEINKLKKMVSEFEEKIIKNDENTEIFARLYDVGLIDELVNAIIKNDGQDEMN